MFNIDLLKSSGVPVKISSTAVGLFIASFVIPIIVALFMVGSFVTNKIQINIMNDRIEETDEQINDEQYADSLKFQRQIESKKSYLKKCIGEVASVIEKKTQWSYCIDAIVKNMPDAMMITNVRVKDGTRKISKPKKDDPEKKIDVVVPIKTLKLTMVGETNKNYDISVRKFKQKLTGNKYLGDKLENVDVAQDLTQINDKYFVEYQVSLVFKPEL